MIDWNKEYEAEERRQYDDWQENVAVRGPNIEPTPPAVRAWSLYDAACDVFAGLVGAGLLALVIGAFVYFMAVPK